MPQYRVLIHGKEYKVDIPNPNERPVRAIIDGEIIEVNVERESESPLQEEESILPTIHKTPSQPTILQASPKLSAAQKPGSTHIIESPLPGIIVSISVKEGDRVETGQELCVLEAMKMNNPVRATKRGRVTEIFVSIGQQVQHGLPLMTVEE